MMWHKHLLHLFYENREPYPDYIEEKNAAPKGYRTVTAIYPFMSHVLSNLLR